MTSIDNAVIDALNQSERIEVPVLIGCKAECAPVRAALAQAGIAVTGELSGLNILSGSIVPDQLDLLKTIQGIESVELDEEASIL